jgi:hypothetical protein
MCTHTSAAVSKTNKLPQTVKQSISFHIILIEEQWRKKEITFGEQKDDRESAKI